MSRSETASVRAAQESLAEIHTWENSFQITKRRNGTLIPAGNTRNTIDTAEIAGQIVATRTDRGIDIIFGSEDAEYAISPDSDRPEYADIVVEHLVEKSAPILIEDMLRDLGFVIKT